ncbi:glutaredoxin [Pseudomonas sp. J452]|uniref:glutaredoxin family protein n=1 Tax=Pseudomonas sp. J452 TaxID=2898441 RepID=UPI0021AE0723|nr:glutaredoxin [Pseudomonas sp. J452]UUY07324.1 glutaredoxin [Pseudomonas sp. J452]
MKRLVLCLIVMVGLYQGWQTFRPHDSTLAYSSGSPYVVVYGRDSCGFTSQMRSGLTRENIEFDYRIVDDGAVADGLHQKMESLGISTQLYDLPVVEVNGRLLVRPDISLVVRAYGEG